MSQTLSSLRTELAARLGFGAQAGAEIIQKPLLDSILQRSQAAIISEFGSQLVGTVYPPMSFADDTDIASVPDNYLLMRALVMAKAHYRQPDSDVAAANSQNYEAGLRGYVA